MKQARSLPTGPVLPVNAAPYRRWCCRSSMCRSHCCRACVWNAGSNGSSEWTSTDASKSMNWSLLKLRRQHPSCRRCQPIPRCRRRSGPLPEPGWSKPPRQPVSEYASSFSVNLDVSTCWLPQLFRRSTALSAMKQRLVGQNQRHHRLHDRDTANPYTWIMPTLRAQIGRRTSAGNRLNRRQDRTGRLESHP